MLSLDKEQLASQVRVALIPLLVLHTALWVGINADTEKATSRLGNLFYLANQPRHYRAFTEGYYYSVIRQDNYPRAVLFFQEAIALFPKTAEVPSHYYKYLGDALVRNNQYQEGITAFSQAYDQNKDLAPASADWPFYYFWAEALVKRGEDLYRSGEVGAADAVWREAVARCSQLITLKPEAEFYQLLGRTLQALGQHSQAAEIYRQALVFAEDNNIRRTLKKDLADAIERTAGASAVPQQADPFTEIKPAEESTSR